MDRLEVVAKLYGKICPNLSLFAVLIKNEDKWIADSYIEEKLGYIDQGHSVNMDREAQVIFDQCKKEMREYINRFRENLCAE